jgi:hypothetical protein
MLVTSRRAVTGGQPGGLAFSVLTMVAEEIVAAVPGFHRLGWRSPFFIAARFW